MGSVESRSKASGSEATVRVPIGDEVQQLHSPKNVYAFRRFLSNNTTLNLNAIEPSWQAKAQAPIHSILTGNRAERNKFLETLLTYGDVDVNLKDLDGDSPLHLAIKNNDFLSIKMLVAFGADVNVVSGDDLTPTELCQFKQRRYYWRHEQSWARISMEDPQINDNSGAVLTLKCPDLLGSIEENGMDLIADHISTSPSTSCDIQSSLEDHRPMPGTCAPSDVESSTEDSKREEVESDFTQLMKSVGGGIRWEQPKGASFSVEASVAPINFSSSAMSYDENTATRTLYKELNDCLRARTNATVPISNADQALAEAHQWTELACFKKTGSRILCLDGGGMKGLIELDVMESIEQQTGKSITELFDWIVGTSTGGILALGLVYAKKSVKELRQLCFRMKDEVFADPEFGIVFNSEALEKMLKDVIGSTEMRMGDIKHPKVIVGATYKGSTPLQLHLFNNCFDDTFSNEVVWKVARATCAGPIMFPEFNNYVDGGILCNNPTEKAITAIQNYHRKKGEKLPISLIVSIGCGIYPDEKLGNVDALDNLAPPRMKNLLKLFSNALGHAELVAETCEHNFMEQGIPYYRFSPCIDESIDAGETDSRKLIDMIIQTRQQTVAKVIEMVAKHL